MHRVHQHPRRGQSFAEVPVYGDLRSPVSKSCTPRGRPPGSTPSSRHSSPGRTSSPAPHRIQWLSLAHQTPSKQHSRKCRSLGPITQQRGEETPSTRGRSRAPSPSAARCGSVASSPSPPIPTPKESPRGRRANKLGARELATKEIYSFLLPPSLFPLDVVEKFEILEGKLMRMTLNSCREVFLDGVRVSYGKQITGIIQPSVIFEIKGMKAESTLLGVPVMLPVRQVSSKGPVFPTLEIQTGIFKKHIQLRKEHLPKYRKRLVPKSVSQ